MKKKTLHRLLGVLVLIGIAIILLPFLQRGKTPPVETPVVKAPPFPDQAVQVPQAEPQSAEKTLAQQEPVAPKEEKPVEETTTVNNAAEKPLTPAAEVSKETKVTSAIKTEAKTATSLFAEKPAAKIVTARTKPNPVTTTKKMTAQRTATPAKTQLEKNGLVNLKTTAWVIQLGNYKNKAEALRMANRLRVNGYNAFIQQISTVMGEQTTIYIGPENKLALAENLAKQLERELHIHGMIVRYQPINM